MRCWRVALMAALLVVPGCSRAARPSRSNETETAPDARMSIDICAGLDPEACGVKGSQLSDDPRTEVDGLSLLRMACARHDGRSCSNLGTEFSSSMNPQIRNAQKAVAAYSDGCKLGYLSACCHAGDLLEEGNGIDKAFTEAAALYKLGCDPGEGVAICCVGLGNLYSKGGRGLAKDRTLRTKYYRRAKLLGYSDTTEDD
jgi:TPR repeat protein